MLEELSDLFGTGVGYVVVITSPAIIKNLRTNLSCSYVFLLV
jgi:hypothetical protein